MMNYRGRRSEELVNQALEILMETPKHGLRRLGRRIVSVVQSGILDMSGVDFRVRLDNGCQVDLQVKSSDLGVHTHLRLCHKFKKFIPVLVVKTQERFDTLVKKVANCIASALLAMRKSFEWQGLAEVHATIKGLNSAVRKINRESRGYKNFQPAFH